MSWTRLGDLLRVERARLGYRTLGEFSKRSGIGLRTLSDLERGARTNYSAETLAMLEAALGWEPGSVRRILDGGEPTREQDEDLVIVLTAWQQLDARARRALRAAAEQLRRD